MVSVTPVKKMVSASYGRYPPRPRPNFRMAAFGPSINHLSCVWLSKSTANRMKIEKDQTISDMAETNTRTASDGKMVTDDQELSLGIRTYLSSSSSGFLGVSKARYSDFLVREVNLSGEVANLTDLSDSVENAENASEGKANEDQQVGQKRKAQEDDSPKPDWDSFEKDLSDLVGRTCAVDGASTDNDNKQPTTVDEWTKKMLDFGRTETGNANEKYLSIPLLSSAAKTDRAAWHNLIRSSPMSKQVVTDTQKEQSKDSTGESKSELYLIRIWHKDFEKEMPNFGKFDPRGRNQGGRHKKHKAPKDKKFLRFVLYKENIDTGAALQQLQRTCGFSFSGGGGRGRGGRGGRNNQQRLRIGHAGMKDKRGVTCQFATVPASTPTHVVLRANQSRAGGGGHTRSGGTALIRVGNFSFVKDDLRLGRLKGNRFNIVLRNLQLGQDDNETTSNGNDERLRSNLQKNVAAAVSDLSKFGFINYYGMQRFGAFHDTHLTGISVFQKDFQKAVDIILEPKEHERDNVRKAREVWANRFVSVDTGDKEKRATAEKEAAKVLLKECGRFMNNERVLCQSLSNHPLDYQRAYYQINKTMRMMFVHATQSYFWNHLATHRIEHFMKDKGHEGVVVGDLVIVGEAPEPTSDETTLPEVHIVTDDDLAESKYSLDHVVLPMIGTNTKMPSYGEGILSDIFRKTGLTIKDLQEFSDKHFSCNGSYRKLICRPQDVDYEMMEYSDPVEPLLQTDLMKSDGIELRCQSYNKRLKESTNAEKNDPNLFGMRVEFTLPSSAYATIALRELMKRPTSSEFQGGLKLHNNEPAVDGETESAQRS